MSCSGRSQGRWVLPVLAVLSAATWSGAATFTVVNTNASGAGSLAQAIIDANAGADADRITFAIPGGGVPTIVAALPAVTQPVEIDGTTQSGGFVEVRNGGGTALTLNGSGSTTGVTIGPAAGSNTITGCRIGTDAAGTAAAANLVGVSVQSPSGGGNAITNSLVSGNTQTGISILGNGTVITGNVIGLNVTQTQALGGSTGILINGGSGNRVGEASCGESNLRRTKTLLKEAGRKMTGVVQALGARRARKTLADAAREALLAAARGLRSDLRTLKHDVRCPDDTP